MPTYVYKFIDSGETIEIYQAFSDEALVEAPHPTDGKPRKVKKVFTPVGITFKGGGFYKTDSAASARSTSSSSSTGSATDGSTNKSSDSANTGNSGTVGGSDSNPSSSPPSSTTTDSGTSTPSPKTAAKPGPAK